jgi:signal-transduction protein with cAMP-binding, CBS, and nucleotidyltransferase domain
MWETKKRANGRISYLLSPSKGAVFADVAQSATGSNSMLEEARQTIARLAQENSQLIARLAELSAPANAPLAPAKKTRWF